MGESLLLLVSLPIHKLDPSESITSLVTFSHHVKAWTRAIIEQFLQRFKWHESSWIKKYQIVLTTSSVQKKENLTTLAVPRRAKAFAWDLSNPSTLPDSKILVVTTFSCIFPKAASNGDSIIDI